MKKECNIVHDIMPLYLEGMVSEDTASFVNEHLKNCPECSTELEGLKNTSDIDPVSVETNQQSSEALPLKAIKKKFRTRRIVTIVAAVLITVVMICVFLNLRHVEIDYGTSKIYSQQDMDAAIKIIKDEFYTWDGCKLYSISYTDDSLCQRELEYCNTLAKEGVTYTECIVFRTYFRSPIFGGDGWNENHKYNYSWYLGRIKDGEWVLLTCGVP